MVVEYMGMGVEELGWWSTWGGSGGVRVVEYMGV